jgi:hypothetical protein
MEDYLVLMALLVGAVIGIVSAEIQSCKEKYATSSSVAFTRTKNRVIRKIQKSI